jgi:hypothetical protein
MARVTVTIEGEPAEVRGALRVLLGMDTADDANGDGIRNTASRWDEDELIELFSRLSAGAREVLGEIARRPDAYANADLQQALGLDGATIGGRLSSVGSALRRTPGKSPLYTYDGATYRMRPEMADIVRRIAGTHGRQEERK